MAVVSTRVQARIIEVLNLPNISGLRDMPSKACAQTMPSPKALGITPKIAMAAAKTFNEPVRISSSFPKY